MADPNTISNIIDVEVTISSGGGSSVQSFGSPIFVSEFADNASFPTRIKAYVGTSAEKLAQLVADGFATTSAAYQMVRRANAQSGPPRTIYVGRKDAGDLDWDETLTAIWAEADADGVSLYALACDTRDAAEIEEIADWVATRGFVLFGAMTSDVAVRDNTPGNVAANIRTKGYDSTWILWHDPTTASGFGPAILTGRTGPFALGAGGTLEVQMDGGATQPFTFAAAAGTRIGSNTQPFVFADGDELDVTVDGGALQTATVSLEAATILSGNAETYDIPAGSTLLLRVDGGAVQPVTFSGTRAFDLGTGTEPFVIGAGEHLDISIDGGAPQVFAFAGTETTAQDCADLLNATGVGFVASDVGGALQITSDSYGTASEVEILVASTAGLLVDLGLPVGSENGTGFAANLALATAAEVAAEINADTTGCVAADDGGSVRITSDVEGTNSRIQITGGTANAGILDFNTNEVTGAGDFADGSAVTAAEVVAWLSAALYGLTIAVDTNAVRLTSKVKGTSSSVAIGASTAATVLGLSGTGNGTGDFADSSVATAAEVATKISATVTDGTAGSASSAVVLTSDTSGDSSTVEVVGGTLASKLFSATSATGTGVEEDYAECAWIGRCITFDLDAADGQSTWTKAPLVGISPDKLTAAQKALLHETQKCNTYTTELGRNETGFGTVCYGTNTAVFRYIDQRVSADWLDARMTEELNNILNSLADKKVKAPYSPVGIAMLAQGFVDVLERAQTNGHTILDLSTIEDEEDTGVTIPTIGQQTQTNIALRRIAGFVARQQFQDAIHRASAGINLTVAESE